MSNLHLLRDRYVLVDTIEQFHHFVKPGDTIYGYSALIPHRVTAIGDKRFLFYRDDVPAWKDMERVGAILNSAALPWRIVWKG